jgi:hypothetical protein
MYPSASRPPVKTEGQLGWWKWIICGSCCGSERGRPIVCAGEKVANGRGSRILASKRLKPQKVQPDRFALATVLRAVAL